MLVYSLFVALVKDNSNKGRRKRQEGGQLSSTNRNLLDGLDLFPEEALRHGSSVEVAKHPEKAYRRPNVSVLESIVKDLETLPAPRLVEVAHYVSRLNPKRREERLAAIQATAGCMSGDEGAAFEQLVREEADRVDADGAK